MISTIVPLPIEKRPGITLPTPENLDRVARDAEAKRQRAAAEVPAQEFGQRYGLSRDFAAFVQRLESRIIELETEVAQLRADRTSALPPHLRNVERR